MSELHEQTTIAKFVPRPIAAVPSDLDKAVSVLGGLFGQFGHVSGFSAGALLSAALWLSLSLGLPSKVVAAEASSGANHAIVSVIQDIGSLASLEAAIESVREDYNG